MPGRRAFATPCRTQSAVPYAARFPTPSTRYEERKALPSIRRIATGALRGIRFADGHSQTHNCPGSNELRREVLRTSVVAKAQLASLDLRTIALAVTES
jgi:hypothetical protein